MQTFLQKFDRAERNILLSCFGTALFLAYCLSTDLTFFYSSLSALNSDKELLASVEKISNDVRYSPSNLPVWEGSYEEQKLYRKDRIFTETESEAKIVFYEGSGFTVEENSLVIIDQVENAPTVNLLRGKITTIVGPSNSSIRILNNGKQVKLLGKNSTVEIEINGDSEKVTATNGTTLFETEEGMITLNKGDVYSSGSQNTPIDLNTPKYGKDGRLLLSWQNPDQKEVLLQVSKNADFTNPTVSKLTNGEQYWYEPRRDGTYYWRVVPKGQEVNNENAAEFIVKLRPDDLKVNTFVSNKNGKTKTVSSFSWEDPVRSEESKYKIQVTRDKSFKSKDILEKTSASSTVSAHNLKPGTYYWRVKNENGSGKWSVIKSFTVEAKQPERLLAVSERPTNLSTTLASKFATPENPTKVTTTWKKTPNIYGYELEISQSKSFVGPPVTLEETNSNKLKVGNIKPGQYFWRVRGILSDGKKGDWSSTRDFKVIDQNEYDRALLLAQAKEAPSSLGTEIEAPIVSGTKTTKANLKWNKNGQDSIAKKIGSLGYEIELASNANFSNGKYYQSSTGGNNFMVDNLQSGTYYWRVRTVLPDGSKGGWSLVKQFVVRKEVTTPPQAVVGQQNAPLPTPTQTIPVPEVVAPIKVKIKTEKLTLVAPDIVYPANKTVIDIKNQKLEWNAIPGSEGYKLEVFSYKNPKEAILTLEPKTNIAKDLNIKPGKYLWRVASISKDKVVTYSKKYTFLVKDIDALKSLEALKPDPNDRITTSQVATVVDFEWMEDKKAAYYKIEASLSPKFSTTFFSQKVESNKAKFNFPQGSFFWRLSSYDKDDDLLKRGKINTFSVAATMGTPNFYGDPSLSYNLKKKEVATDVEITWSTVPRADRYDIEIASDEEFSLTQLSNSQIETNISLTLEHGKYFARVRAVDSYGFGSTWSESKVIDVTSADLETGPKIIIPKDNATFVYRKDPNDIAFRWRKIKNAVIYEFQVSKSDSFNSFVLNLKSPEETVIHKLPEGDFYWRVRSFDNNGFSTSWSKVQTLTVKKEGSTLSLTYPVSDKNVVSYGSGKSNFSFKWNAPKDITQFTVVVAKDENFTEIISKETIVGKRVASLDIEHNGPTYWLVEGENIKEKFKVRSDTGKFNIVSPSDERWDKSGKVSIGIQPSSGSYKSEGSTTKASSIAGVVAGRYWVFDSFGLGIALGSGNETLSMESGEDLSFQNTKASFHLILRQKILATSRYNFDVLGYAGLKMSQIPRVEADSSDPNQLKITSESMQYLSLGLGVSRILTENWQLDLGGFYESAMGETQTISSASNIAFLITLQQKILTNWQLGYGYQFESLTYKLKESDTTVSKPTNALELSFGKGF